MLKQINLKNKTFIDGSRKWNSRTIFIRVEVH